MNTLIIVIAGLLLSTPTIIHAKTANSPAGVGKRYTIKQAAIEYKITGKMFSGSEELYFDRYGMREAKYSQQIINVMGMQQRNHTATFIDYEDDAVIYTYDYQTKTGSRMESPLKDVVQKKDVTELGKDMMVQMGGKKVGRGTVLGKACEIWEIKNMGTRIWLWNWIPLKTVTSMMGMEMTVEATKISLDFDKKKLVKPRVEYRDVSKRLKGIKGLDMLKRR